MTINRSGINLNAYATFGEDVGTGTTVYVGKTDINTLQFRTVSHRGTGINVFAEGGNLIVSGNTQNRPSDVEHTLTVAKSGGNFTTIEAALDSITDNDVNTRYVILVSAGQYIENNPLIGKEYVNICAIGDYQTTRIEAANPNEDLFTMAKFFTIDGFAFWGVTGAANYAINQSISGLTSVSRCYFAECSNGIKLNHPGGQMAVDSCGIYSLAYPMIDGIYVSAGEMNINTFVASFGNVTNLIMVSGIAAVAVINNVISSLSTLTNGIVVKDLGDVDINGARLLNMSTGLECDGGSRTNINASRIENASVDGVRINDVGINTSLNILSTIIDGSAGFDINILSNTALLTGFAKTSIDKFNFVSGAKIYSTIIDVKEDDEGFNVLGELHVGIPERGAESVFGEGDSYTRGMKVYTFDGSSYIDVSDAAGSASVSTFTFPNVNSGTAIYVASSLHDDIDKLKHQGIKTKINTAMSLGGGELQTQYYNGSSWEVFNKMEIGADDDYFSNADAIFEDVVNLNHHIRYDIMLANDGWVKNDPVSFGTDLFWVRFIITSNIITAPVFEQFKLHTSRFEINKNGFVEYFGDARPIGQLPLSLSLGRPFEGTMQNQDLYSSQNVGVGGSTNKFTTTTDKLGVCGFLPFDVDTSSPLNLIWSGHPNTTGTYEWTVRWVWLTDGDVVTYIEPGAPIVNSGVVIISGDTVVDTIVTFEASLDISKMVARRDVGFGDQLWVSIQPTILPNSFTLGSNQITYTKWSEGGHI